MRQPRNRLTRNLEYPHEAGAHRLASWRLILSGMATGVGPLVAAAALIKLLA
jgi:hypothetical protein